MAMARKAGFTPEREWNANALCENEAIVQCRCVTGARQIAFGCATNVRNSQILSVDCWLGMSKIDNILYRL